MPRRRFLKTGAGAALAALALGAGADGLLTGVLV